MWQEALGTATPEVWKKSIQHAEKEINKWWDREIGFDRDDVNPLIININGESEDSSCYDSESDW